MNNMCAVVSERCSGLMSHGMYDSQKCIWERLACKALCNMHSVTRFHISVVGRNKVPHNHLNCMNCKRIGKITICCGYICLNRMCHCIHSGVSNELLRHSFCQIRIHDRNVRCNLKVSNRILNTLLIICDDWECGYFRRSSRCGWNCTEMSFAAKLRKSEHLTHILKSNFRILILNPHSLRCINRWSSTHCNDPVRLKLKHLLCALHDGFNGRIRLDTLNQVDLHSRFLQVVDGSVKESKSLHRASAYTDNCLLSLERLESLKGAFSVIQITR